MLKKSASLLLAILICLCAFTGCGENGSAAASSGQSEQNAASGSQEPMDELPDFTQEQPESSEQSSTYKSTIPDKYKLKAPIGFTGTTKPEFSAETGTFICDKYILTLDDTWVCERAYEDYTGVYGYIGKGYGGSMLVNITDKPDLPPAGEDPLEYYKYQIADNTGEYNLKEEAARTINGVNAYCYWYESPTTYMNIMYAFYTTDYYTYELAGSFTESEAAFDAVQYALGTFKTLDPENKDE